MWFQEVYYVYSQGIYDVLVEKDCLIICVWWERECVKLWEQEVALKIDL